MVRIRTVDDQSRRRQRLALIAGIRAQGKTLLSAAQEDTMKTRIRLAMLDLDIAVGWLNQDAVELQSQVLRIIDATIDVATRNIAIVAKALDDVEFNKTG
jgi:hypothetical protein